jgi:hypothetical protein
MSNFNFNKNIIEKIPIEGYVGLFEETQECISIRNEYFETTNKYFKGLVSFEEYNKIFEKYFEFKNTNNEFNRRVL